MSAKFTPGPWSKRAIAAALRAAHKHDGGWIDELGDGENMPDEDDAHLIAAAPEHLALLEEAVGYGAKLFEQDEPVEAADLVATLQGEAI